MTLHPLSRHLLSLSIILYSSLEYINGQTTYLDANSTAQIHAIYGSNQRVYDVNKDLPEFGGPAGFTPTPSSARTDYVKSRAFMAIPGAGVAVLILLIGLIYSIVRCCSRDKYRNADVIVAKHGHHADTYENAYAGAGAGQMNGAVYSDDKDAIAYEKRGNGVFWYLISLLMMIACAGLAGASLWFNQEAHGNMNVLSYQSSNIFNDVTTFTNQVVALFSGQTTVTSIADSVLNSINSYRYIGDDVSTYSHDFELGRFPGTIAIMGFVMLSFLMLLIGAPHVLARRVPVVGSCSRGWLILTAIIMTFTSIIVWLLFAIYLPALKFNADLCVYADAQEQQLNLTFGGIQVGQVASACLLNNNPLVVYGVSSSAAQSLSCQFVGQDYYAAKSALCKDKGLIDDASFLTLFSFIIGVLMIPATMITCHLSRRRPRHGKVLYDPQPQPLAISPPNSITTQSAHSSYTPTHNIASESPHNYTYDQPAPAYNTNYSSSNASSLPHSYQYA